MLTVVRQLPWFSQEFTLSISAQDGGGQTSQAPAQVTISLVDPSSQSTPVFTESLYNFQIAEDAGTMSYVGQVEASVQGNAAHLFFLILVSYFVKST